MDAPGRKAQYVKSKRTKDKPRSSTLTKGGIEAGTPRSRVVNLVNIFMVDI